MKKGDKVEFIDTEMHELSPRQFPPKGTIGVLAEDDTDGSPYIQWPLGSTSGNDCWWCNVERLKLVEEVNIVGEAGMPKMR